MKNSQRLRIALQKNGRLHQYSMELLKSCGLKVQAGKNALLYHCANLPMDILLVRDDDIPPLVGEAIADVGIVGENVLRERELQHLGGGEAKQCVLVKKLGFGHCRLSLAVPENHSFSGPQDLQGKRIATSYVHILRHYLQQHAIVADILPLSGSVEVAPRLGMADVICDLVSSGLTLEENNLKEVLSIMTSQAVLMKTLATLSEEKQAIFDLLLRRMEGVLQAQESKYIMLHAPKANIEAITALLPGTESPTMLPLEGCDSKLVVHVVTHEAVFWSTLERLKAAGASSILVLPIEKMLR